MVVLSTLIPTRRPKTSLLYNNEQLCSSKSSFADGEKKPNSIIIVVLSCRQNFLQRKLIRQTYGSIRQLNNVHILAVVFTLGGLDAADDQKTDIDQLEAEKIEFGDVVMGDFVDTYKNLTRKSIMAYEWLVSFCHEADLVVKTDDDVMLDIFKLTDELGKWTPNVIRSFHFWCAVHWSEVFDRNETSRYYVSFEEYPDDRVPKHCAGVGYVAPMVVIDYIADEISTSFPDVVCPQEDIFMTGIVPKRINSSKGQHIEFIDKLSQWILYVLEMNEEDNAIYLLDLIQQSSNETDVDFDEFRRRFDTRIFYLIDHGDGFERGFTRLWYLLEKNYEIERESGVNQNW